MKKEIVTYTSFDLNLGDNIRKINNQTLLSLINSIDKLEENFSNIDSISNIRDINCNNGYFIFDALGDIKVINGRDKVFFTDSNLKYLKSNKKARKQDLLSVNREIYKQVINILINKLVRGTHVNNIIFLHFELDTEFKYLNEKVELNQEEKSFVGEVNRHLIMIKNIIVEKVPNINIIKNRIYLKNQEDRSIYISNENLNGVCKKVGQIIESNSIFRGEKVHPSINSIRYCFSKAKLRNKDRLLIIFSAFSKDEPKYNYMNTLNYIDCNKLFILDDYGDKGTYYFGLNGQLDVETSVVSLISKIMSDNNILFNNVISIGTSKGGSAALYYGMKYNYGNIIIGAPQYKIGSYLSDLSIKTYAKDIFGKINFANRLKYDNIIRLVSNNKSKIYMLTSNGDNQYKKLLKEFENICEELKIDLNKYECDINQHNEIAQVFPEFLIKKLNELLSVNNYKGYVLNKSVRFLNNFKRQKRGRK